jgi:PAS domain S-box-containing protein
MKKFDNKVPADNYKKTIEYSPNGVMFVDENFIIRSLNRSAEMLTSIKSEDAIGQPLSQMLPELDIKAEDYKGERTYRRKINGRDLHIKPFNLPSTTTGEENTYVLLFHDDISQLSLASELEHTQHLIDELQDIIEHSFDGILVTDGEGNVILVNQAYIKNTGIQRDQLMGHNIKELINPVWMKNSVAVLVAEQKRPISMQHTTQNNKNIVVTGTPIFNKNNEVKRIIINTRDVSEIYNLQEELCRAREIEKLYFERMSENFEDISDNKDPIVVISEKMKAVFLLAKRLASFNTTVLITGDSGVGKEEVAKYIHNNSIRKDKMFIAVNCGAIPENLLESELFGYVEGAFTGAVKGGKPGLFEAANGGTLFLDEIGEMSMNLQVKLLRIIDSRTINRVGSPESIPVDIRIITATNRNLNEMVAIGSFREDLFYRLNVVSMIIPPLRERTEDITPMVLKFMHSFNAQYGQKKKITYDVLKELEAYKWPGNVRELKNIVENMVVVSNNEYLQLGDIPWLAEKYKAEEHSIGQPITMQEAIENTERKLLKDAKEKYGSTRRIAEILGIDQSTVVRKIKKYDI